MNPSILSLLPPCLTIISAITTQAILPSLLLGIFTAAFIVTNGAPLEAMQLTLIRLQDALTLKHGLSLQTLTESSQLAIFIFLLCLGCLISLISHSGGAFAYAQTKKGETLSQKRASLDTIVLAFSLCIDDYFNTITVGSVMKTITDHAKMPRIRLAFIITSLATTLCAIVPFSSWGAEIMIQLANVGVSAHSSKLILAEPMYVYVLAIPCVLQAWSAIANLFTYVYTPVYFGPFRRHTVIAEETGNLWGGKESPQVSVSPTPDRNKAHASLFDFFTPLVMLITFLASGLYYAGIDKTAQSLAISGSLTLILTITLLLLRRKLTFKELPTLLQEGCSLMLATLFMLSAAWTLSWIVTNDLQTGVYLANNFPQSVSPIFLPPVAYLMAIGITIGVGSAWASIALLLPIILPLAIQLLGLATPVIPITAPIIFVLIGAIISGSLLGNQVSPIADVTVMASNCAGAHHIDFMQAQFAYAVPQVFSVTTGYLLLGWTSLHATSWHQWALMISIIASMILLFPGVYIAIRNKQYKEIR